MNNVKVKFALANIIIHHNLNTVTMQHVRVPAAVDHGNTKAKHHKAFQRAHRHFFRSSEHPHHSTYV